MSIVVSDTPLTIAGIGTYDVDDTSVNKNWVSEVRSNISQKIDMGFGTTFDSHVIAGYRFLMRYYETVGLMLFVLDNSWC